MALVVKGDRTKPLIMLQLLPLGQLYLNYRERNGMLHAWWNIISILSNPSLHKTVNKYDAETLLTRKEQVWKSKIIYCWVQPSDFVFQIIIDIRLVAVGLQAILHLLIFKIIILRQILGINQKLKRTKAKPPLSLLEEKSHKLVPYRQN